MLAKSNEYFIVLAESSEKSQVTNRDGVRNRRLYEVQCRKCGRKLTLLKNAIDTYKSCGCDRGRKGRLHSGKTVKQWAQESGISANTIRVRLQRGATIEEAVAKPYDPREKPLGLQTARKYSGKTVKQWAEESNVSATTIYNRLRRGESIEAAIRPADQPGLKPRLYDGLDIYDYAKKHGISVTTARKRV